MTDPIVLVDSSRILNGQLDTVRDAIGELVAFVEANESQVIAYHMYVSDDGASMTVIQVHPDSASLEYHMRIAAPIFAKFKDLIALSSMDVYGKPSQELLQQLRRKAELLGPAPLAVHDLQAGLSRFGGV